MSLRKMSLKSSPAKPSIIDLKEKLLQWTCERRATNKTLDRQLLRTEALKLATSFGFTGFKCSEGWLTLFLKKHGFSPSLTNCSGPKFPDYRVWIDSLRSLINQYRYKDLFNVDELVMYSEFVPANFFFGTGELQQNGENVAKSHEQSFPSSRTNRIRIMLCSNSSGTEKLPALISGSYQLDESPNGCCYYRNEDYTIPDEIFADWLVRLNEQMSVTDRRILLLLNSDRISASNKFSQLSHVNLVYFPKDFPAQFKPLRGDVFHHVKMTYRSRYVRQILSSNANESWDGDEIVSSIVQAWKTVSQEIVIASFQRTKFREDESSLRIECTDWEKLGTGVSFKRFVTFDDDLCDNSVLDDFELSTGGQGHGYNLRNSSSGTVDLDDCGTILDDKRQRSNKNDERVIGETPRDSCEGVAQPNESHVYSGLTEESRNNETSVESTDGANCSFENDNCSAMDVANDESEANPDERQLESTLSDTILRCDETGRSVDDANFGPSGNDDSRITKRSGDYFDGSELATKRARSEESTTCSWAKRYETDFVFGPDVHASASNRTDGN